MLIGQFTYTACQAPGPYSTTPGWKVKQAAGHHGGAELPPAAVKAAVRSFGVFAAPAVPPLATQLEIEQLPRCLRLDVLEGQYRSVAHLAAAGRDHSGRDAFFAHGLLVLLTNREVPLAFHQTGAAAGETLRPADLWGAQGWLTPYRAEAIEAAIVGAPPAPGDSSPLDPERREDFADLHPEQREFVFAASEQVITLRTQLVIVGMPVEAAMWIAQITHLLLPSVGWSVAFSTYEATATADTLRTGAPMIIGVPVEVGPVWRQVPAERAIVHDPAVSRPRESGGYRLADGSLMPVGGWAELAEAVCVLGWEDQVRHAIDELGGRVGSALDPWPLIGLPAAVLSLAMATLDHQPAVAELAARVAMQHIPSDLSTAPDVLGELLAAVLHWSPGPLQAAQTMLVALDRTATHPGAPTRGVVVDRLLDGYLRRLLSGPDAFSGPAGPWLPDRLRLSPQLGDRLLTDLDGLVGWVDTVDNRVVQIRLVLAIADLAGRQGWLDEPATRVRVESVVGDRARTHVVAALAGVGPRPSAGSWPPIPGWLWNDVLVDALQAHLADRPPGSVLTDPHIRRVVDEAAGPLPAVYVAGETLTTLTAVDGERAAALLMTSHPGGHPMGAEQIEILRAAAFLRSVVSAQGSLLVKPDQLNGALRQWFPEGELRAVVLADLIEQLRLSLDRPDMAAFAAAALGSVAPEAVTASIVRGLLSAGARMSDLMGTPAEWHMQCAQPVPSTSRAVGVPTMPLTRPDAPETRLLQALADGRIGAPMAMEVRRRLARWILVLAAEILDLPGHDDTRDGFEWLKSAQRPPLRSHLERLYPEMARSILMELDPARRRPQVAADVLAAEWVVRSRMAEMGVGGDPARRFFRMGASSGDDSVWAAGIRALVSPGTRNKEELSAWVGRVGRSANAAARMPHLSTRFEEPPDRLYESAVEFAERLTAISSPMGRIWRSPTRRGRA